eukprot:scaffold34878_cov183-Amphora_coffeaeformis.AAC.2
MGFFLGHVAMHGGGLPDLTLWQPQPGSRQLEDSMNNDLHDHNPSSQLRTPKLADGCHHVFLDVGANLGVHGRFLLEPDKYPKAKMAHRIFARNFGYSHSNNSSALYHNADSRDFCIFAFEPNPAHHTRHRTLSQAYAALGWRYHLIPKGVSDEESVLKFYRRGDVDKEEWGFSFIPPPSPKGNGIDGSSNGAVDPDSVVDIPVIRLARWIEDHIEGRLPADRVYGTYHDASTPKVVMKMDVEGMEYRVFPDLLYSGVLCRTLDKVFGEVHRRDVRFPLTLANGDVLRNDVEGSILWNSMMRLLKANPTCKGRWLESDDESYLHDGQPLPGRDSLRPRR